MKRAILGRFVKLTGVAGVILVAVGPAGAENTAVITEMRNRVIYQSSSGQERPAQVKDTLKPADTVRTEDRSLAELEFTDKTLVRLGSRSVFTFSPDTRDFRVGKGVTLVCVPKGKGGQIVTAAVTAAIEGTTVLTEEIEVRRGNGPPRLATKIIFIEGKGRIIHGGHERPIHGGQMLLQFADDPKMVEVLNIDLNALVGGSALFQAFGRNLPSSDAVLDVIREQQRDLSSGTLEPTGFSIGGTGSSQQFSVEQQRTLETPPVNDPPPVNPSVAQGASSWQTSHQPPSPTPTPTPPTYTYPSPPTYTPSSPPSPPPF